jgi:putative ABC transport system permease protein
MRALPQDFKYAFRQLWKNPGFALTALLSLGLGIGATTAVFSVVYAVLMNPYPYKNPERMVHLVLKDRAGHERWPGLTGSQIQRLRLAWCVESATGQDDWNLTTTGEDLPEDVSGIYLTANAFQFFGVPALAGREFGPSDAPDGQDPQPVVVLGYKFWQRHYGGDRQVVGHRIQLVHKTYVIIGIMPPRFAWGDGDVYLPLKLTSDPKTAFSPEIRLKPGITYKAADASLQPLLQEFAKERPAQFPEHFEVALKGLNDQFVERIGRTLFLLLTAVAFLLLIGCANVSILLLARGTARGHELAVRAAVGASRFRIMTQLLIESLALSVGGALLGVLLAYQAVALIAAWLPEGSFPSEAAIEINLPVLLFSIGLALLTSILFGLSPALSLSRPEIAQVIQANTRKATGGVKGRQTNNILIAGQMALTVILLTAAGAAIGGFLHLLHVGLGYDPHNVMSVGIPVHDNTYMTWEKRSTYFEQLRQRIAAMPEVVSAGISSNATPPNNGWETNFEIFGRPPREDAQLSANFVSPEYFSVLRIPLDQGRLWSGTETARGARVAVINETMARQFWPNGDAIGHQMRLPKMKSDSQYSPAVPHSDGWFEVIGVVADARDDGLRNAIKPGVYMPYSVFMRMYTQILVRTKIAPLALLHSVRAQVLTVDADQQVTGNVRNLDQWITTQPEWAQQRLVASLFGAFAVLATLLAAVGLYSVVSYTVAQRTNEIGIRMSLGARRNHILRLVFASTAGSVGIGLVAGVVMSYGLNKLSEAWTEGSSRDPMILVGVVALLAGSAAIACFVPARRASSIDPMIAVRSQ